MNMCIYIYILKAQLIDAAKTGRLYPKSPSACLPASARGQFRRNAPLEGKQISPAGDRNPSRARLGEVSDGGL